MRRLTENLEMRLFEVKDITDRYVNALDFDHDLLSMTEARHTQWDRAKIIAYVERCQNTEDSELIGVFLKQTQKHIGNIRLSSMTEIHQRVDFGFMFHERSEWGKGYATEALKGICEYVFDELHYHRICADYYAINVASEKVFKKAGFVVEGIFKDHFLFNGQFIDSVRVAKVKTIS